MFDRSFRIVLFAALSLVAALAAPGTVTNAADVPGGSALAAATPIPVPRAPGFFDYMTVDAQYRRLLVAHASNNTLAIVDVDGGSVLSQVDLGEDASSAGVAVDVRDGKYFVGTTADKVVDVNRKNMVRQQDIKLPGPVDAIAFDPNNDTLYADEDRGSHVWAINGRTDKLVATIPLPGVPEYVDYDPVTGRIFQNIKTEPSQVLAIDTQSNSVAATWPTAPAERVHGLAIDGATGRVFSVGLNGKLAILDAKSGALVATVDIEGRVDQIAVDPSTKRVYCPSVTGVLTVVQETDTGGTVVGSVVVPRGTHSVAVDPQTHAVWISYGAPDNDYVEKLTPNP